MKPEEQELLSSIIDVTQEYGSVFSPDNNNINIG